MEVDEIKKLIATAEEMRTRLYISHKRLALNRTPENFEIFKTTVNDYKKMLTTITANESSACYVKAS